MADKPDITVYCLSMQTIKVEGCLEAEFIMNDPWLDHEPPIGDLVGFSDGTLLRIAFDKRVDAWRISPIARGPALLGIEQLSEDEKVRCSDRAYLSAVDWLVHGIDHAPRAH